MPARPVNQPPNLVDLDKMRPAGLHGGGSPIARIRPVMSRQPDSIEKFSARAAYYGHRIPYHPQLISDLAQSLAVTENSRLLDLCCGTGELATGFIDHVGRIFAVDGSREMLSLAVRHEKIAYAQCDVNAETFRAPEPVDHIIVGRAVHWINPKGLANQVEANLRDGGKIAVCSVRWRAADDWREPYCRVLYRYRAASNRANFDYTGKTILGAIGFTAVDDVAITAQFRLNLDRKSTRLNSSHT